MKRRGIKTPLVAARFFTLVLLCGYAPGIRIRTSETGREFSTEPPRSGAVRG